MVVQFTCLRRSPNVTKTQVHLLASVTLVDDDVVSGARNHVEGVKSRRAYRTG